MYYASFWDSPTNETSPFCKTSCEASSLDNTGWWLQNCSALAIRTPVVPKESNYGGEVV